MQYPIKKIGSLMKKLLIFFYAVLISCSFNQQIKVLNTKISDRYFDLLEKRVWSIHKLMAIYIF
jgi:hypothetical protein